jgi:hypothetical protein
MMQTTTTPTTKQEAIARARRNRKVFCYPSSKADQRIIRKGIADWISDSNPNKNGFYKMLWALLYKVNKEGKECKYLYFNEGQQRLFLDRDFEAWAKETSIEIHKLLCRAQAI